MYVIGYKQDEIDNSGYKQDEIDQIKLFLLIYIIGIVGTSNQVQI